MPFQKQLPLPKGSNFSLKMFLVCHRLYKHFSEKEEEVTPYKKKAKYALLAGVTKAGMYLFC